MRVLVVEDEAGLADGLRRGLEAEGYAVDVARDGPEGLARAAQDRYDLIVLDIMLPGTNGYVVCRTLRERGDTTPILMLTAKDGEWDEAEALDTGADDFLAKPFSYVVLLARLRALLRRRSGERSPVLVAGDLRLDPAARRCWVNDAVVELANREFALAEYLVRNAGLVVSKQDVIDHVWDHAFDGDPNIVEVYIGRLRKKIDRPFDRHSITTVRGSGYRLDARPR